MNVWFWLLYAWKHKFYFNSNFHISTIVLHLYAGYHSGSRNPLLAPLLSPGRV